METNIKDKSILLIAPIFYNYHELIKKSLTKQGAKVTFIQEKEYNFLSKFLGHINSYLYAQYHKKFLKSRINENSDKDFDYVLVIHGEFVDEKIINLIKHLFKESKIVAYHWDSLIHNKNGLSTLELYDKVYSFDKNDVNRLRSLEYLPLFHTVNENLSKYQEVNAERDLLFIGVDYSDRITITQKIARDCEKLNLKFDNFLITSKFSYIRKKMTFKKRYRNTVASDFRFAKISHNDFLDKIKTSKCVLDINFEGQAGLTMRTIEVLSLGKKLITTNEWIKYEPFYDENLICVIDRKQPLITKSFFDCEMPKVDMTYYHLDNWVRLIFK